MADALPLSTALFRNASFTRFWGVRVASTLAYQMQAVAIGWQVYDLTGSALQLGLVGLVQFLPALLLAFVTGPVADRYDRRLVLRVCQTVEALAAAGLLAATLGGLLSMPTIFAAIFVLGAARAFEAPTMQALLPGLVPLGLLPRALALSTSALQSAIIVGPALGGFLYAIAPTAVYGVAAALFLCASLAIAGVVLERPAAARPPVTLSSIFAGVAFIRSRPVVLGAISLDLFAVLLGGATALLPIFARDILQTSPLGLGLLRTAPAIGALTVSVLLARYPLQRRVGPIMFGAVLVFGLATVLFALSQSFWLSLAALVILGASDSVSVVIRSSLVQLETPDDMRGRVSAVNFIFIGTSNQLGEFESGLTAHWFGAVPAAALGGIGTIVVALTWMGLFPALRRFNRLGTGPDA